MHIVIFPICIDKLFISADSCMVSATHRHLSSQIFNKLMLYTWNLSGTFFSAFYPMLGI